MTKKIIKNTLLVSLIITFLSSCSTAPLNENDEKKLDRYNGKSVSETIGISKKIKS